ncbi:type II secretion system protein GspM [Sphingomonas sp. dw_22]|uniref:type II secretion system protein GspM n=1 Tax=Sphingomonas sp. dw_22 TaxID=2721175 RepID=UPI001BD2D4F5|nr:type II secretion system protein GspM [Sphingomonas sp. dw_22]
MIGSVSSRERRLIALLILTAVVAAAYYLVIEPILAGFSARADRTEQLAATYVHNLRTIAAIPRLRREAEGRRAAAATFVVNAKNIEAGREYLKDRLQRAIEGAGGEFREGSDAEGQPGWARARATARVTLPQLTASLTRLQNEPPWIIVESVSVTASDALVTGQPSAMDVEIEASVPLRPAAGR